MANVGGGREGEVRCSPITWSYLGVVIRAWIVLMLEPKECCGVPLPSLPSFIWVVVLPSLAWHCSPTSVVCAASLRLLRVGCRAPVVKSKFIELSVKK